MASRLCRDGEATVRYALATWPRVSGAALRRTRGDPRRIARLIAQRSSLPLETIVGMVEGAGAGSGR